MDGGGGSVVIVGTYVKIFFSSRYTRKEDGLQKIDRDLVDGKFRQRD